MKVAKMALREARRQNQQHDLIPLAALISREMKNEKMEKPSVCYGYAAQSKKGEDYYLVKTDCQRVPGNSSSTFSVFAVCNHYSSLHSVFFSFFLFNLGIFKYFFLLI